MAGGLAKTMTWLIRLFQLFFAVILVGVLSYMINQFRHYNMSAPREVVVPEVFVCPSPSLFPLYARLT